MEIRINEFIQGARKAEGVTVIIDVFRAFSVACYAFDGGVRRIIDVREPAEAFELRDKCRHETILAGEREEKMIEGFDAGNSPTEILTANLNGKTMIHTTTAGTNGICNAVYATRILGASLVNASATAEYIKQLSPDIVTLVAMGYRAECSADEDLLCARYIRDLLNGLNPDISNEIRELRTGSGSRFFDPANVKHSPPSDFFLCTDLNRFGFALKAVVNDNGHAEIFKIDMK
ncbi:MAG TPA: 2-phosphosulfolactate phosphatase [Bacteroidales bacterium]|nr:2-phosphosulfolactate phosphatase [Bacteroidales bacterium]HPT12932.1 2-phosphosulfolactate phosphatase [Bacteroidales bacterium]